MGAVTPAESLELVYLIAKRDPTRLSRYAGRWLQLWLDQHRDPTLTEVALVVGCLSALDGPRHVHAAQTLRGLV